MNNVISISEVDVKYAYIIELTNYVKYRKKGRIQDIFNFFPKKRKVMVVVLEGNRTFLRIQTTQR